MVHSARLSLADLPHWFCQRCEQLGCCPPATFDQIHLAREIDARCVAATLCVCMCERGAGGVRDDGEGVATRCERDATAIALEGGSAMSGGYCDSL